MEIDKLKPGCSVYFVGIKGTGVCALAELMHNAGIKVTGSDTEEKFYTDEILKELQIPYYENFDASRITKDIDIVIHSAAYSAELNSELARAAQIGLDIIKYSDALGDWSSRFDSVGICGVHGKTTTTALCGVFARAAGLPAQVLTGSAAVDFGGRSTLHLGDKYFIAETCEYRKHFLSFHPKRIILTSVESDHQDYFPDYESIRNAFIEYCRLLPNKGRLIYCCDDNGANETAHLVKNERNDIELIPYGFTASGDYKIIHYYVDNERAVFKLAGFDGGFKLRLPGFHSALNAAAAIALTGLLVRKEFNEELPLCTEKLSAVKEALENFKSTKRRSEILGDVPCRQGGGSIIFMDDYGHHPTAVKTTLKGIKSFYPSRRLIVSFMSHTYSRTSALLEEFASCFNDADILYLHKIYASAREKYDGKIDGKALFEKTAQKRSVLNKETFYIEETEEAFTPLANLLKPGDLFITMGAGNNRPLCEKLCKHFMKENL